MRSNKALIRSILALALVILGTSVTTILADPIGLWAETGVITETVSGDNDAFTHADGPTPDWVQVATSHSPSPRYEHAMAYDSARGVVVLFGGQNGSDLFNDTWEYDGTDWTLVATANRPSARFNHAMAYDASRGVTVLFGGWDGSSYLGDSWEYDGTDWTRRTPSISPQQGVNMH